MDASGYTDIFATKGLEYLVVLCFLIGIVVFVRVLNRRASGGGPGRKTR